MRDDLLASTAHRALQPLLMGMGLGLPGLGLSSNHGGPFPPAGFVFLIDDDGALLIDDDGAFLIEEI